MRFMSIWFPGYPMDLKEKINRTLDLWAMRSSDWLPKRLTYWIAMCQIGKATMTSQNVPATSLDNVLDNLGNLREGKPLKQFKWHESMRYPEDDHSVHVHVNPKDFPPVNAIDIDKMTAEEREKLPPVVKDVLAGLESVDKKES